MDFLQAEKKFKHLKNQFESGSLSEPEFKTQLEELMVQDERGDWWMIGYETERWYRHDGTNWVQTDPPGGLAQDSVLREQPDLELAEKAEAEKHRLEKEKEAAEKLAAQKAEQEQKEKIKAEEAGTLHSKGMIAQKEGKYDEAELLYRQSLAIAVDLKDEQGKANILRQLAILSQERMDIEKRERENAEKSARAKAEREVAEKATPDQSYRQPPTQSAPAVQPSKPQARNWVTYGAVIVVGGAVIVVGIVVLSAVGSWIVSILNPPVTPALVEPIEPVAAYAGSYEAASGGGHLLTDRTLTLNTPVGGTLTFWTWYDIETEFDYGFVEASTDGGATWTPLPGNITVTSNNPYNSDAWTNNSLISGLTTTDTAITGSSDGWVEATFTLPADNGVLVRFNYYTDSSANGQGWFIDDVSINGFSDGFEDGAGANWDLGGWTVTTASEEPVFEEALTEEPALPDVGFAVMAGGALEQAIRGEFAGTTVTVDSAFEVDEPDGVNFDESVQAFENATGITVNYVGSREFESNIYVRVDAGDAPDIVDFPQPALFADFVRRGNVVPVTDFISDEWLSQQYNPGWREFNTVDGVEAGVMHRYSGWSLVWYPKAAWDAAGYEIPQTWDELIDLTYQIADDGGTPWCIGIESGAATGWVATDWTEDLMLRTTSLENYDAWVAGDLPFDSDEVKTAIAFWSEIWFNDALVYGGWSSIVSTSFLDAPAPMFEDPPQCWLHKQASFISSFFPEGTEYGVDYDFFYLPPVDESYGRPFLISGDLMAMFNDRPEVRALMEYFTTPQSVSGWLEGSGVIAAQQTATQDMYGSDLDWGVSQLVAEATSFRFDGSGLMPSEVGAGSFWEFITSYIAGHVDLDTAMQEIDATWPR